MGSQTRQVGGIYHQHGVKLETDRPRLNVAYAGQQQGGQQLPIAQTLLDPRSHLLQQSVPPAFFQHSHEGLDFRPESDGLRV